MIPYHVGQLSRVLRPQRRWVLTQVWKPRRDDDQLAVPERPGAVSRYDFPRSPDALLVEADRLSRGERIYQRVSIGLPLVALLTVLSVPIGLVTFSMLYGKRRKSVRHPSPAEVEHFLDCAALPRLLKAGELAKLVHAKKPTVVVYFRPDQGDEEATKLRLLFLLLGEISATPGSALDVYRVDTKQGFPHFNRHLRDEVQRAGSTLVQLVIPAEPESHVMPILQPVSATSFISQLSRTLGDFQVAFSKEQDAQTHMDAVLSRLRRCLFSLKLEGRAAFVEGNSLQQMEAHCNQLLRVAKGT